MRALSLLLLLVTASGPCQAAMYKWVDEEGNVVYSQHPPPPDVQTEEIKKDSYGVDAESARSALHELREKAEKERLKREVKEDLAQSEVERQERIEQNCEIARQNLTLLESSAQVVLKDADGNDATLSEEERQNKLLDAQAQIDTYCK